jgi:hypothetical protein
MLRYGVHETMVSKNVWVGDLAKIFVMGHYTVAGVLLAQFLIQALYNCHNIRCLHLFRQL